MAEITTKAGVEELESRGDVRLEFVTLDDTVNITIMLLFYRLKIE